MQRLRFVASRILNALAVALLVPWLALFLLGRAPGDYLSDLAANPQLSTSTLAQMRTQYGLDQPLHKKYTTWVRNTASGDFGFSFVYQRPIRELVGARVWNTVLLNGLALLVAWTLGVGVSVAAAIPRRPWANWLIGALASLVVAIPAVLLALVLLALAGPLGLPVGGMTAQDGEGFSFVARVVDLLRHLLLPVIAVSAVWFPAVIRHTRAALDAALGEPYIVTAQAKGVTRARLVLRHALGNALNPLATFFGLSVSALLSASLPVEVVMGWPGVGQLTYDAVLKRDVFLVMDLAVVAALLLLAGNLLGDLLLWWSDPRLSTTSREARP